MPFNMKRENRFYHYPRLWDEYMEVKRLQDEGKYIRLTDDDSQTIGSSIDRTYVNNVFDKLADRIADRIINEIYNAKDKEEKEEKEEKDIKKEE